jgi:hypothetical protein
MRFKKSSHPHQQTKPPRAVSTMSAPDTKATKGTHRSPQSRSDSTLHSVPKPLSLQKHPGTSNTPPPPQQTPSRHNKPPVALINYPKSRTTAQIQPPPSQKNTSTPRLNLLAMEQKSFDIRLCEPHIGHGLSFVFQPLCDRFLIIDYSQVSLRPDDRIVVHGAKSNF